MSDRKKKAFQNFGEKKKNEKESEKSLPPLERDAHSHTPQPRRRPTPLRARERKLESGEVSRAKTWLRVLCVSTKSS